MENMSYPVVREKVVRLRVLNIEFESRLVSVSMLSPSASFDPVMGSVFGVSNLANRRDR